MSMTPTLRRRHLVHAAAALALLLPAAQQALAQAILKDPDVASLSSFIGVDGNNVTLNSGRFLINLKPRESRSSTAAEVIRIML